VVRAQGWEFHRHLGKTRASAVARALTHEICGCEAEYCTGIVEEVEDGGTDASVSVETKIFVDEGGQSQIENRRAKAPAQYRRCL